MEIKMSDEGKLREFVTSSQPYLKRMVKGSSLNRKKQNKANRKRTRETLRRKNSIKIMGKYSRVFFPS